MKHLLLIPLLALLSFGAQAALYINNNTGCDLTMELYAHDINHSICGLHSNWFVLPGNNSVAYNNVTVLNTTPPLWINGPAVLTGGTAAWGWDATKFYFNVSTFGGVVGNTGSCVSNTSTVVPGACNGANVTVTWETYNGNTIIDIN